MPDGSKWDVPCDRIAQHRAAYYAKKDTGMTTGDLFAVAFTSEYEYTMGDDYELKDWAANNMNWKDVKSCAVRVVESAAVTDYQDGWVNGEKEIVER